MLQRNPWIPTLFFFPILYALGWLIVRPLLLVRPSIDVDDLSLIGTLITFLCFLLLAPSWVKLRWRNPYPWNGLGLKEDHIKHIIPLFCKGLIYSILLNIFMLFVLFSGSWVNGFGVISYGALINALFLGLGVGFAEELIFRGWLFGEMMLLIGPRWAIIGQAAIYSLLHLPFQLPISDFLGLFLGVFLFGILLAIMRIGEGGSLYSCIGLHGGLVGGWFSLNSGLIEVSKDAPAWLIGPGEDVSNPMGGMIVITFLLICLFYKRSAFRRLGLFFDLTVNASSNKDLP